MKLKIILFISMAFFLTKSQAQDITWGETKKNNTKANNYWPIGQDKGKTFVYHGKFSGVTTFDGEFKGIIEVYDSNMKLESSVELEKKEKGQKSKDISEVETAIWTKDNILIIRSKYDKSNDSKKLYSQTYDRSTAKPSPTEKEFGDLASTKKYKTKINITISPDETKILVFGELQKIKGQPSEYIFYVLDTDGKLLWKRQTTFGKSSDTKYQDIEISNSGVVYAVISELDSNNDLKGVSICYLDDEDSNDKSFKIEPGYELSFTRFNLEVTPSGSITYSSFHKNGCFYEELEADLAKSINKKEFDINELAETAIFESDRAVKSKKIGNELKSIEVLEYIFHDDKSTTITGQYYGIKQVRSQGVITTTFYYYDLMLINFDASGNITWCKRIPKRQYLDAVSVKYGGAAITNFDDNIQLFYNDHVDNFETGTADRLSRVKHSETVKVVVTSDGEITKKTLFTGEETKFLLDVYSSYTASSNYMFLSRSAPVKGMTGLDNLSFGLAKF